MYMNYMCGVEMFLKYFCWWDGKITEFDFQQVCIQSVSTIAHTHTHLQHQHFVCQPEREFYGEISRNQKLYICTWYKSSWLCSLN